MGKIKSLNFGGTVKDLRKQWGLKQKELAENLGITPSYLSQIEHNEQKPSVDLMAKMAAYFDIPVSSIVFKAINFDNLENKNQQKNFKAAQPIIEKLMNYLLNTPKSKTNEQST